MDIEDMIAPSAIADWLRDEEAANCPDPRHANWALAAADTIEHLEKEFKAAKGYMLNAAIDLETGAPKLTALRTINGGIARLDETLRGFE
jgi:hypothetical protein